MHNFLFCIAMLTFILFSSSGCASQIDDMDDPRVSLENFKFTDYSRLGVIRFARTYFPIGTKKSFVDSVFIDKGNARELPRRHDRPESGLSEVPYKYEYNDLYECTIVVTFTFDKDDIVQREARLSGGCL